MSNSVRTPTPEQREAINRDQNAVVSAGAGSGKTSVLVERYARLVERDGIPVDAILALTFTRKAAAEMNTRIYARLSRSEDPRTRAQLEQFDKARISTLDSFCSAVARGACHRFGLPPDFAVDEARLARISDEAAVELMLDRKDDAALRRLVAANGFDRVRGDLLAAIARERVSVAAEPSFAADARRQVSALRAAVAATAAALEDACAAILGIDEDGGDSLLSAQDAVRALLPFPEIPPTGEIEEETLDALSAAASAAAAIRKPGAGKKPGLLMLKEMIPPLREAASELKVLAESYRLREDIAAVGELLDDFARRFLERKRREGIVSFHDAATLATEILVRDPEIRAHYKSRIRAIMIDEFQDNNALQKDLLYLLSEREDRCAPGIPAPEDLRPDKLFFVGDEKQSIYRFRGADVSVFRTLSSELDRTAAGKTDLSLSVNHRSSAELVAFFNAVFPGIFGPAEHAYEARFSPIGTLKEGAPRGQVSGDAPPAVEFHIFDAGSSTGDEEHELAAAESVAYAAARRIAEGAAAGEFGFGDVAILFRSTTHQHEYERALRRYGVPYRATDPRGLFSEGPFNDFYALLRLALIPSDLNAYAAVLRSPFVNLGDDALARIFLDGKREPFPDAPPDSWFADPGDRDRFARGSELYRSVRADIDRVAVSALVARLWYDEGYRASLLDDPDRRTCLDHFSALYSLALDADGRRLPLTAFLDELTPLMGSSDRIEGDESDAPSGTGVALLTVHKSKGLEFPVVLIADAGSESRGSRNAGTYYVDRDYGVVVNLRREDAARGERVGNWFFNRAKEEEDRHETAELRRLLYVAATRAERKLLVFGARRTNKTMEEAIDGVEGHERARAILSLAKVDASGERKAPKSFLDLFAEGFATPEGAVARYAAFAVPPLPERERRPAGAAAVDLRPAADFYAGAPALPRREARRTVTPTALERALSANRRPSGHATAGDQDLAVLPVDGILSDFGLEKLFGTLCHLAVEHAFSAPEGAPFSPRLEFPADLAEGDRSLLVESARILAAGFLGSELGVLAREAKRRRVEFPFLLALEDPAGAERPLVLSGAMDLVFEAGSGADGRCVVVDFKTDKAIDPAAHAGQLACYRAAAGAFSDLPAESWLFYLRSGIARRVGEEVDLYRSALAAAQTGDTL